MAYTDRYFMPGEIVLTFEGEAPKSPAELKDYLSGLFDDIAEIAARTARSTVDIVGASRFNEFFREIPEYDSDELNLQKYLNRFFSRMFTDEPVKPIVVGGQEHLFVQTKLNDQQLLLFVISLNEVIRNRASEEEVLKAVAPNWLIISSDPEQSGLGGPGTYPVEVRDPADQYCFTIYAPHNGNPRWDDFFVSECNGADGEVIVAVLDTYPDKNHAGLPESEKIKNNKFLENIVKQVEPDSAEVDNVVQGILDTMAQNQENNDGIHAKGHNYRMSSHGLFVTSLIHMIAPQSKIKVYRVLNEYGVGTSYTIMKGLAKVEDYRKLSNSDVPLVINMSLTMTLPFSIQQIRTAPDEIKELLTLIISSIISEANKHKKGERSFKCDKNDLGCQLRYAVQSVIELLSENKAIIIAAAGNANLGGARPDASFPASFKNVIGVAALENLAEQPKNQDKIPVNFADYSSQADKPSNEGFAVFGGNINAQDTDTVQQFLAQGLKEKLDGFVYRATSDSKDRLVGLYIDEFPIPNGKGEFKPQDNTTGWASWSGTSFAAPIITGAIAKLLICGEIDPVNKLQEGWKESSASGGEVPHAVLAVQGTKDAQGNCNAVIQNAEKDR